ncbi:MAG: zinc-binding dehydrogenase [Burkholderiaceae bacterium]
MNDIPSSFRQIRSEVTADGHLRVSLAEVAMPRPGADEVLVRVRASPINPSDLGLLYAAADLATARREGSGADAALVADVPAAAMPAMRGRLGQSMAVGNEGAGVVVAAGDGAAAQALIGKTVAAFGGEMYAEYRCLKAAQCMPVPDELDPRDAASCFVNPLTALSMPETMRMDGHKALVHTAAASNLGRMLNRICLADGIPLISIVRKPEQEALLRQEGATIVLDSSDADFERKLIEAIAETGATLAFDAIGGGPLGGRILMAMEVAQSRGAAYSRYGSAIHKQVYVYGRLSNAPIEIPPAVGLAWGMGGYLLTYFLQRIDADARRRLQGRVLAELKTTFASHYSHEISFEQVLDVATAQAANRKATGEKYLIRSGH